MRKEFYTKSLLVLVRGNNALKKNQFVPLKAVPDLTRTRTPNVFVADFLLPKAMRSNVVRKTSSVTVVAQSVTMPDAAERKAIMQLGEIHQPDGIGHSG